MNRVEHWERVYHTKGPDQVSWFQAEARLSRLLVESVAPDRGARIIDIGAGASTLVDGLLAARYQNITVLDISNAALTIARDRVGSTGATVTWQQADVLAATLPARGFDVWHDRAVFHFLTDATDRIRYVDQVRRAVQPGGYVLVATFAEDGPMRCSGLEVARYAPAELHAQFGAGFRLIESHREMHATPSGVMQAFTYCVCQVVSDAPTQHAA
jgi:2-polyprenyl-3-methyl-5-hydroxy-6-metoxy-1,4-benzoquinol methylase